MPQGYFRRGASFGGVLKPLPMAYQVTARRYKGTEILLAEHSPVTKRNARINLSLFPSSLDVIVSKYYGCAETQVSRIWQALREAERERARALAGKNEAESERIDRESASEERVAPPVKDTDRRNGLRHARETTLLIYGSDADKQPFHEESETLDVNENGCLLTLLSAVSRGQRLFLTNMTNQAEQECRVVYVGRRVRGRARVGVEFIGPAPHFWRPA
jgi:hypothetical protein